MAPLKGVPYEPMAPLKGVPYDPAAVALFPSDEDRFSIEERDRRSKDEQVAHGQHGADAQQDVGIQDYAADELRDLKDADGNDEDQRAELLRASGIVHARRRADGELEAEQRGERTDEEHQPEGARCKQRPPDARLGDESNQHHIQGEAGRGQ